MSTEDHDLRTSRAYIGHVQQMLKTIGLSLKSRLEDHHQGLFDEGEHYLIEVKRGDEAAQAWRDETLDDKTTHEISAVRVMNRMMSGVIQKRQKDLFPWVTFCFKPALIDEGDGQSFAFLNLKAVRNVSRTLWAMIHVYQPNDEKRSPELCVYVSRHLPALDQVIEPQLRIPLGNQHKLACDERNRINASGALFSDNTNLGNPLQSMPLFVDVNEARDREKMSLTLKNIGEEPLTICEINFRDFDEEDHETKSIKVKGLKINQVIAINKEIKVSLERINEEATDFESLVVGYCEGTEADLDEDEELSADEELVIGLQGGDERQCHVFLSQGEAYDLLKVALLNPDSIIEEQGEEIDLKGLVDGTAPIEDDELDEELEDEEPSMLMLNEADFEGGSVGTVVLSIKTSRPKEDFQPQLSESDEAEVHEGNLTYEGGSSVSLSFKKPKDGKSSIKNTKASHGKSKNSAKSTLNEVLLDLIYLGRISFYNDLKTPDQSKMREFILNCVAASTLIRICQLSTLSDDVSGEQAQENIA